MTNKCRNWRAIRAMFKEILFPFEHKINSSQLFDYTVIIFELHDKIGYAWVLHMLGRSVVYVEICVMCIDIRLEKLVEYST